MQRDTTRLGVYGYAVMYRLEPGVATHRLVGVSAGRSA